MDKRLIDIYKTKRKLESHCNQSILDMEKINKFLRSQRDPKVHDERTAREESSESSARTDQQSDSVREFFYGAEK